MADAAKRTVRLRTQEQTLSRVYDSITSRAALSNRTIREPLELIKDKIFRSLDQDWHELCKGFISKSVEIGKKKVASMMCIWRKIWKSLHSHIHTARFCSRTRRTKVWNDLACKVNSKVTFYMRPLQSANLENGVIMFSSLKCSKSNSNLTL